MTDPTITCPHCHQEIKLTESLAAPLVASAQVEFERRLQAKDAEVAERETQRETAMREREEAVRRARESVEAAVALKVGEERAKIVAEEAKKARQVVGAELELKATELAGTRSAMQEIAGKLAEVQAEAQKGQAEVMAKQRALDDARRELDMTVQKRVLETVAAEREKLQKEAEERAGLKVMEKEQTIAGMRKQIEDLRRKAEQGSQQLQGEVAELQMERLLRERFPLDEIVPVPKGVFGGDLLQRVFAGGATANREIRDPGGAGAGFCGTILWESKRTKNWSDGWLAKLREDQRAAKAEVAVLVTAVLPKGVETFGEVEGVWVAEVRYAVPLAMVLRQWLMDVAAARQAGAGQATKMQLVYKYLTGPRFRQRVEAIVEKFRDLSEDLGKERRYMMNAWAKRETQLQGVLESTLGLYGDLQGIAGKALPEIEGLGQLPEGKASEAAPEPEVVAEVRVVERVVERVKVRQLPGGLFRE